MNQETRNAGATAIYGVIGWPLAQSLSPLLHNTGFAALGISALYQRWEVPPEKLPAFVDSVRLLNIQGCSVTIPHKVHLMPLLDDVTPLAKKVGAANTIYWNGNSLCGENTDVAGFLAPLAEENLSGASVLLLGAGGAARAVAAGLTTLSGSRCPANIFVATPSDTSHLPLAEEFGLTPLLWKERHDPATLLVINTTPLGMRGKAEDETPYDFATASALPPKSVAGTTPMAYDIVYNPLETRFLREARAAGRRCISGLEMFFGQGDAQFRLWTGQSLPKESHSALTAALQRQ